MHIFGIMIWNKTHETLSHIAVFFLGVEQSLYIAPGPNCRAPPRSETAEAEAEATRVETPRRCQTLSGYSWEASIS